MTQLQQPSTTFIYNASPSDLETGYRFIVPIPNPEADHTAIVHRVWELANATGASVQFLGLCTDAQAESAIRRTLVTLSAMMNYGRVSADFKVLFGKQWVEAIRSQTQPGDILVYWHKQNTGLLQANLDIPTHIITGIKQNKETHTHWPAQVMAWLGSLVIIIGSFWLQVEIARTTSQWETALQILSLSGGVGLIWLWNSLFG